MDFKQELKVVLADEFIAKVRETEEGLEITFLDGHTYLIKIKKVA